MRWMPRLSLQKDYLSDSYDFEDDAEGWLLQLEWLGVIVGLSILRRGALVRERRRLARGGKA